MHLSHALHAGDAVAVVGAGPSGVVLASELARAGLAPIVIEAGDVLGGQWAAGTPQSAVWPGMRANTSGAMTRFSSLPVPADWPVFPSAEQVRDGLQAHADATGVTARVIAGTRVRSARRVGEGWALELEDVRSGALRTLRVAAVAACSGRFATPALPAGLGTPAARVEVLHAGAYRGAGAFSGRRVLVLGNSISGLEIAADLAHDRSVTVVSACRTPRWIIPKLARGVPADQEWFTAFADLTGRSLPPADLASGLRAALLAVAGDPAAAGGLRPDPNPLVAGLSQSQDYLPLVAEGRIDVRPAIRSIDGDVVSFADGSACVVDAIVLATGYARALPWLDEADADPDGLVLETFHPDRPGLALMGQYVLVGPYLPVLELQARWIAGVWSGRLALDDAPPLPPLPGYLHHMLAGAFAVAAGAAPDPQEHPDLAEALVFGPMLPERYRLEDPAARARFAAATAGFAAPPEQLGLHAALTGGAVVAAVG